MNNIKKNSAFFIFYFMISLLIIMVSGLQDNGGQVNTQFKLMEFNDVINIFLLNSAQIILWFVVSPFLLSFPLVFKFIYSIGQGPNNSDINQFIYYISSLSHGLGEIIISFIVLIFTVKHLYYFIQFFKTRETKPLTMLYFKLIKKYIPISLGVLLISAFCEVYISNRLLIHFLGE